MCFFFKQKTAYEVRISDWSSYVCSSHLVYTFFDPEAQARGLGTLAVLEQIRLARLSNLDYVYLGYWVESSRKMDYKRRFHPLEALQGTQWRALDVGKTRQIDIPETIASRSEEHTSELQSLMRISYAVFCLKKKKKYPKRE